MDRLNALRKVLDAARAALAALVGVAVLLADNGDVLGLPSGVTAAIASAVALAGQWGLRTKTTPHLEPDPSQVPELEDTPEFDAVAGTDVPELADTAESDAVEGTVPATLGSPGTGTATAPPRARRREVAPPRSEEEEPQPSGE